MHQLVERWTGRLDEAERQAIQALGERHTRETDIDQKTSHDAEAIAYAKLHCFERNSVVAKRQLLGEALRHGMGSVTVDGVHQQLHQQGVITRHMHGRDWATTPEVLAEERFMIKQAREGRGSVQPLNDTWNIKRDWMNAGQKDAVAHLLQSKDSFVMIRGGAGTGKTTLMHEAIEGIEAGGRKVLTFAPSAQASRGVLAGEGFKATTVAELLVSEELQQEARGNLIWIDEAGLLGTRTLKHVMEIAQKMDARLVVSGDWKQHGAVERGAAMRLLEQEAGIQPAIVKKIQRQDGPYREAVAMLAEGNTGKGFEAIDKLGWVHEIDDAQQRYSAMAQSYANGWEAGESVLAIAPTHAEAELLTERIRGELKLRGHVSREQMTFEQLKPMRLTEAEKSDAKRVAEGDVMVFQRSTRKTKKGTRMEATLESAEQHKKQAAQFEVYQRQEIKLGRGDLVRITGNGKSKDGKQSLHNGMTYKIDSFNKHGDMVLTNGWVIDRDYGFLAPGYVSTSHSAQGKTVDRVIIAESAMSYPAIDQAQFYVSVSRGRKQAEIYTDDKAALMEAVQKHDARVTATELMHDSEPPRILRFERQQADAVVSQHREREAIYDRG